LSPIVTRHDERVGFPRRLADASLLLSYVDHEAYGYGKVKIEGN